MKILHVSTSDRLGGAAIGANRLHRALRRAGIDSHMLVLRKVTADPNAHALATRLNRFGRARRRLAERRHARQLARHPRNAASGYWSLNSFDYPIADAINRFDADVVNLHWLGGNTLPISQLAKIRAPLVWTLRDMWAFSGGCHYSGDCARYQAACGDCPQLLSPAHNDISRQLHSAKWRHWSSVDMTIVCISRWLADCARQSALMRERRIEVIGNPLDTAVFKPLDKATARRAFNLPLDKQLILFGAIGGASDARKGFKYLAEALQGMASDADAEVVVFGAEQTEDLALGMPAHQIGSLQDETSLSLLYSACDVYVMPSLQEGLGNTALEALACGAPCVSFDGTGTRDPIQHRRNGYLAQMRDSADLLAGIRWALAQPPSRDELHADLAASYGESVIAAQYRDLYRSLLDSSP